MTRKYEFIICTHACQLAISSATSGFYCIHYQPMLGDYVINERKSKSARVNPGEPTALLDFYPILEWEYWYKNSPSSKGILCLQPNERGEMTEI
jgi:hypothetical protein